MALLEPKTGWFRYPFIVICMFDCPEQTHTSPIKTLFNVTALPSEMAILKGPPADGVFTFSFQFPSLSDLAV